jgi:hypothetical protein
LVAALNNCDSAEGLLARTKNAWRISRITDSPSLTVIVLSILALTEAITNA